jgi:hypothetical protein
MRLVADVDVEQLFGARIGEHHFAEGVDRQHRIGQARQELWQLRTEL